MKTNTQSWAVALSRVQGPTRRLRAGLLLAAALPVAVLAAPRYLATDLGVVPGYDQSRAVQLNDAGTAASASEVFDSSGNWTGSAGMVWAAGVGYTALAGLPGFSKSFGYGLNQAGQAVGIGDNDGSSYHALLWAGPGLSHQVCGGQGL